MNVGDIAILNIYDVAYRYIINVVSKREAMGLQNSVNSIDKTGLL